MIDILLLLLAYGFLLDWLLQKVDADVGRLPWVFQQQLQLCRRPWGFHLVIDAVKIS